MPPQRILIVEDQRDISRLFRSALETLQRDIQVIESPSGEEALLDVLHNPVDLLVADYYLPGMNGIELMGKIRKSNPQVKIFLITGLSDPNKRQLVAEAGADAYFYKPVSMTDFLDMVKQHLGFERMAPPVETIHAVPETQNPQSQPDILSHLREDLRGNAVYLLDEAGGILVSAGKIPGEDDETSLFTLVQSLQTTGRTASGLTGKDQTNIMYISIGGGIDLIHTPVEGKSSLLVIGEGLANESARKRNEALIQTACRQLIEASLPNFRERTIDQVPPVPPRETKINPKQELEPLLSEIGKLIPTEDVQDFWDKAAENHKGKTADNRLTYEQAKKLGLAPENEG